MDRALSDALERVAEGGYLLGVDVFRWRNDPACVTAIRFWFNRSQVTFLADADEDTLTAGVGLVAIEDEGTWLGLPARGVWADCIGALVRQAWVLTNDGGRADGVRVEFNGTADRGPRIVEFVVVESAFRFFEALEF